MPQIFQKGDSEQVLV